MDDIKVVNDDLYDESKDRYIGLKVPLPIGGEIKEGTVKRRKRDDNSDELIGTAHSNPLLDSRLYEVEFPDGSYTDYAANVIIENLFDQMDDHGRTVLEMSEVVDHRKNDEAIEIKDSWIEMENGIKKRKITTKG